MPWVWLFTAVLILTPAPSRPARTLDGHSVGTYDLPASLSL